MTTLIERIKAALDATKGSVQAEVAAAEAEVTKVKVEVVDFVAPAVRTVHDVIADIEAGAQLVVDLTTKQQETADAIAQAKATLASLRTEFDAHKATLEAKLSA